MVGKKERYETLHDEHAPPQDGIEKAIVEILKERGALAAQDLFAEVERRGFAEQEARVHVSYLLDRGWLEFTWESTLRVLSERLNPAPTDLL